MAEQRNPSARPWPCSDTDVARVAARLCPGARVPTLRQALRRAERARNGRVRLLRRAVRRDTYHVPAGFIAAAILAEARCFSMAARPAANDHAPVID